MDEAVKPLSGVWALAMPAPVQSVLAVPKVKLTAGIAKPCTAPVTVALSCGVEPRAWVTPPAIVVLIASWALFTLKGSQPEVLPGYVLSPPYTAWNEYLPAPSAPVTSETSGLPMVTGVANTLFAWTQSSPVKKVKVTVPLLAGAPMIVGK